MSIEIEFLHILLLSLFLGSINVNSLQCDDNRCKTGSCDTAGTCICNLPGPSTILDGDRLFLGGTFCDEEHIMCDGTNSFWCEHGATCEEIVHGENYTCKCRPGYSGVHCEHSGAPCGSIFCFHEAECLVEDDVCECLPDWKGSVDCSLPTPTPIHANSATNSNSTRLRQEERSNNTNWWVVVLAVSCSIGAVVGAVIYTKKFFRKKETAVPKFQQLSQMQTHGFLDDDEDDSAVPDVIHSDTAQL